MSPDQNVTYVTGLDRRSTPPSRAGLKALQRAPGVNARLRVCKVLKKL